MADPSDLTPLLDPRSVAIVGASEDPTRIGGRPIRYMKAAGFEGAIYPVNPNRETVQALPAYPALADLPADIDFAVIALPAARVVETARAAAERGAKGCMVFSSGFAEFDEAGVAMQAELSALAGETGMRIVGPNCLGLFNAAAGFYPTFTSSLDGNLPDPGPLSIASQSGAFGSHLFYLAKTRGIGLRSWITTGNECDLHVAECIAWLAADPETKAIVAYLEGAKDGDALVESLELACKHETPVIFMKVGRSEVGAEAAASHTASLAGSDAIYDAVLKQYGAHRAATTDELIDIAYAACRGVLPKGRKLGVVTISGGAGVMIADAAEDHGLDVAAMPADGQASLKALLPYAAARNPVDVTAQAFNDLSLISRNLRIMLTEGGYDSLVAFFTMVASAPTIAAPVRAALRAGLDGHDDIPVALSILGPEEIKRFYEDDGLLVFEDPSRAVAAIAALRGFAERFAAHRAAERVPPPSAPDPLPAGPYNEARSKAVLAAAGLPVVEERQASSAREARRIAAAFGAPLAMKILSADLPHKTDIGGVRLAVDPGAAGEAFESMMTAVRAAVPAADLDGVLISPMAPPGVETILGVQVDPVFGPMVMFGIGGVFVEILEDVTFRRAPFGLGTARAMIDGIRGRAILDGARGTPPADLDALADALVALSNLAWARRAEIASIDVNPFRVFETGALALDAQIVRLPDRPKASGILPGKRRPIRR